MLPPFILQSQVIIEFKTSRAEQLVQLLAQKTDKPIAIAESFDYRSQEIPSPAVNLTAKEGEFLEKLKVKLGEVDPKDPHYGFNFGRVDVTTFCTGHFGINEMNWARYNFTMTGNGPGVRPDRGLKPQNKADLSTFNFRNLITDGKVSLPKVVRVPVDILLDSHFSKKLFFYPNYSGQVVDLYDRGSDEKSFLSTLATAINCQLVETADAYRFEPLINNIRKGVTNWVDCSENNNWPFQGQYKIKAKALYEVSDDQVKLMWVPYPYKYDMPIESAIPITDPEIKGFLEQLAKQRVPEAYKNKVDYNRPVIWMYTRVLPGLGYIGKDPKLQISVF